MTSGTIPYSAYFATIRATRALGGIAGYGIPLNSWRSMMVVRSSPVIVSVDWPWLGAGVHLLAGDDAVERGRPGRR